MSVLRIKGVKFHNREELKFQTKIILPDEVKTKLIPLLGKKTTLSFKCGHRWKMFVGFIQRETHCDCSEHGIEAGYFLYIEK